MAQVKQITREFLRTLRTELDTVIRGIALQHGVDLSVGDASFGATDFTFKLEGKLAGTPAPDAVRYTENSARLGLPPLGTEVTFNRVKYAVTGLKARISKSCVIITRVADGKVFNCSLDMLKVAAELAGALPKPVATLSLADFVREVNALNRAEVDKLKAKGGMFGAECHPLPDYLLKHYHEQGLTPAETLRQLEAESEAEGRAEALAS